MTDIPIFITSDSVQPSPRWRQAFPDGELRSLAGSDVRGGVPAEAACVIWLSTSLPDWAASLAGLQETWPAARVVILSMEPDDDEALKAFDFGARAYCHALATPALLREVAAAVAGGGLWVGPELLARFLGGIRERMQRSAASPGSAPDPAADPGVRLSPRELEVARAVAEGRSNREIADLFGITERTVKAHLGAAFDKTGARDRLQLALYVAELERDRLARTRSQGRSNELRQA